MKNKISILLILFSRLTIAQLESEKFTNFKINRESQELGGLIKCFEVGLSEHEDLKNNERVPPFFWNLRLELLKNKGSISIQTSAPCGSELRICSCDVEAVRNFITLQKNAEQALFNQFGFQLRSETLCIFSGKDDSKAILTVNERNQVESKNKAVIKEGEFFAITLPCKVVSAVIRDKNVSNAELGYRAANMLRSGENAEYHCEKFSMKLTHWTEENDRNMLINVEQFFPGKKSK